MSDWLLESFSVCGSEQMWKGGLKNNGGSIMKL